MVIEPALTDRHSSTLNVLDNLWQMPCAVETDSVVGVNSRRVPYESRIPTDDVSGRTSGAEDIPGAAS